MPILLTRSHRAEDLVAALAADLRRHAPDDPFLPQTIVVGSRGMERWLRNEVATRNDVAAQLMFPFPRQALDGAAAVLLARAQSEAPAGPALSLALETPEDDADPFGPLPLTFRLLDMLDPSAHMDDFAAVRRYLTEGAADGAGGVSPRQLAFAAEVADVLDSLLHDRPETACAWAADPSIAPPAHRFIAHLLAGLAAHTDPRSPALRRLAIAGLPPMDSELRLFLFGLSTLGPGDRALLAALGRCMTLHLYLLAPSDRYWGDIRTRRAVARDWQRATTVSEVQRLESELASENPILSALGLPSRDIQLWLESLDPPYEERGDVALTAPPPENLLTGVQTFVREAQGLTDVETPIPTDSSISLISTHGAMRQCEVLADELLGMFADDATLEPRHILVMTPDVETYAPLLSAVFARRCQTSAGTKLPAIPVAIADLGLRRTNPIAEVLLQALEIAGERLTASRLMDFMALEPVSRRLGLTPEELGDVRILIDTSGFRWGLDAADRAAADQPPLDQNTARFALERMALGALFGDEEKTPLDTLQGDVDDLPPAVPLPIEGRERLRLFGAIAGVVRRLQALRAEFQSAVPMSEWFDRLHRTLDDLAATTPSGAWLRLEVDRQLRAITTAAGDEHPPLSREALLRFLTGRFELPQRGDPAPKTPGGAVTVCSLEPMRSVPFPVVALIGMDDGRFPRGRSPRGWDPMSDPAPGERDRRVIDRHLLLEALLSARKRFLLLWEGRSVMTNEKLPAAVPVEELIDTLSVLTGRDRETLIDRRPLQPWNPKNFCVEGSGGTSAAPRSFDHALAEAVNGLARIACGDEQPKPRGLVASAHQDLPPELDPPRTIPLTKLVQGLNRPQKMLLQDRLRLYSPSDAPPLQDREPLEADKLVTWGFRNRLLTAMRPSALYATPHDRLVDLLTARLRGEGTLPLAAAGQRLVIDEVRVCKDTVENFQTAAGAPTDQALPLRVRLDDGTELIGAAQDVRERDGEQLLEWLEASSGIGPRSLLMSWVHLLAARAMGMPVRGTRTVGTGPVPARAPVAGAFLACDVDADEARRALTDLVALWRLARCRPLALFQRSSSALASVLAQGDALTPAALVQKAGQEVRKAWFRQPFAGAIPGEAADEHIALLFGDWDPIAALEEELPSLPDPPEYGFVDLARRVWLPVSRAAGAGKQLAKQSPGDA